MATWSNWKRFPNPERGGYVEAPIGAGLYEVRRISNGSLYDFNASGNVALALSSLTAKRSRSARAARPWCAAAAA